MRFIETRAFRWLDERLHLDPLVHLSREKVIPVHRFSAIYCFGGMTLFLFGVQVCTGILLMLYYRPSAEDAFASVQLIMTDVQFGWLVRSIHSWSANLMVFAAFVHLVTVYFAKAYRPPRELTWVTGCLLFFLILGFGFSGYLLPWNQLAFFATKVGTEIVGVIPGIGEPILKLLRGGDRVTGATVSRFFGFHVAVMPALTTVVLGVHLYLVQVHGMSVPPRVEEEAKRRKPMPFLPHYALRDVFGWVLMLGVLAALAALFPWELGEKADPFSPAPANIRPEWYFIFMFQTLKVFPGGEVLGVPLEVIPILVFGLGAVLLLLVPFLDRGVVRSGRSPIFTAAGVVVLAFMVGMTAWGYQSPVPLFVVLATAALIAGFAVVVRREDREP